ncbi:189_t:CDS:1, partial [Scutellospora calospora]
KDDEIFEFKHKLQNVHLNYLNDENDNIKSDNIENDNIENELFRHSKFTYKNYFVRIDNIKMKYEKNFSDKQSAYDEGFNPFYYVFGDGTFGTNYDANQSISNNEFKTTEEFNINDVEVKYKSLETNEGIVDNK